MPGSVSIVGEAVLRCCSISGSLNDRSGMWRGIVVMKKKNECIQHFFLHYHICTVRAIHVHSHMKKIVRVSFTILCH